MIMIFIKIMNAYKLVLKLKYLHFYKNHKILKVVRVTYFNVKGVL